MWITYPDYKKQLPRLWQIVNRAILAKFLGPDILNVSVNCEL